MDNLEEYLPATEVGFIEYSGIKLISCENGHAEGVIEVKPHHLNPGGALHGGLLFTLMDTIGGFATHSVGVLPTTLTSNINYLRPAVNTKTVTAVADVLKRGKTVTVVRIDLIDDKGVLVASGATNYFDLNDRVSGEK